MTENNDWLIGFFRDQARLGFEEGDYGRTRNSCEKLIYLDPSDVGAWGWLGEAALASQDTATAVRCFEQLLELQPYQAEHAVNLGKAYLQLKAWDAAAAAFTQALSLSPSDPSILHLLSLVERMRQALEALNQSSGEQPGRNEPCPCGSGLKYKKCCLAKTTQNAWQQQLLDAETSEDWARVLAVLAELGQSTPETQRSEALARYKLGQRHQSKPLLLACYRYKGEDAEVLAALADLSLDDHDLKTSEKLALRSLALEPNGWRARLVLAVCHIRHGQVAAAESELRELVRRTPSCRMGWERLSELLREQGRGGDALAALEEWVQRNPENAEAWFRLGYAMVAMGLPPLQSQPYFEETLARNPEHAEALCWLGHCRQQAGNLAEAQQFMLRGLQLKPSFGQGWNLLGMLYHSIGRQQESEGCFMRAVAITPDIPFPWNNLANTYLDAGELSEAEQVIRQAIRLNGDIASLWNNLGNILGAGQRISESIACYEKALQLDPQAPDARANYGVALANFVRLDESINTLLPLSQTIEKARSNLLFAANYHPDWPIERIFQIYRDQAERFFPARCYFDYANDRTAQRRLRVGYVSPDFRKHSCAIFIQPLLEHHDHNRFEVFAYSEVRCEDEISERMKGFVDHWRRTVGMADEALAELIRTDEIDILVDLAGHTANNRLAVFALKPAPVQVTWLGFGYTTGLTSMDYYLTDAETIPYGHEAAFTEKPWRVRSPSFAYTPPNVTAVSPLPAKRNGYITFGTLTRPIRLNYKVIRVWAEILNRIPGSKLIINSGPFLDSGLREHFAAEFAKHGVEKERLDMGCTSPPWPILDSMDIALDCFPHNSGTTLFDSLWMGLPFITLRDRPSMGRLGATILRGLGREEWIANSEAEYIEKAVMLASDLDALEKIRLGLRQAMQASPLCDGADFAACVEEAYRGMWQHFCEQGEPQ